MRMITSEQREYLRNLMADRMNAKPILQDEKYNADAMPETKDTFTVKGVYHRRKLTPQEVIRAVETLPGMGIDKLRNAAASVLLIETFRMTGATVATLLHISSNLVRQNVRLHQKRLRTNPKYRYLIRESMERAHGRMIEAPENIRVEETAA